MTVTPVLRKMPMIWGVGGEHGDNPCAACGKQMKGKRWSVHVIDGGSNALHPADELQYQSDGGDMGLHFVGPECRKKFGEFVSYDESELNIPTAYALACQIFRKRRSLWG